MAGLEGWTDGQRRPVLRRGLRVDHLGDERLVLDPASGVVHTVRGAAVGALDAVLSGRAPRHDDVAASLIGAGIIEVRGISRRDALVLAGSASALVASVVLPTAAAAASAEVATVTGSDGVLRTVTLTDGSLLYSLTHENNAAGAVTRNLVVGSAPKNVEVVLVGGGGAGGSGESGSTIYGGGGGGGEVRYLNLGSVSASTNFELIVAGQAFDSSGQDTTLNNLSDVSTVGVADGGGIGGGTAAAGSGGSGGGGSSSQTTAGSTTTPADLTDGQYGSDGADGGVNLSGGGGGARATGGTVAATGVGDVGGRGGDAIALSNFFDLDGVTVEGQLNLGGGGGGASSGGSLSDFSTPGDGAGEGGLIRDSGAAYGGGNGLAGSGGGGGGGASKSANVATGGTGATGAIWIRVS